MAAAKTYTSTVYIESAPERVWAGLTDPELTPRRVHGWDPSH